MRRKQLQPNLGIGSDISPKPQDFFIKHSQPGWARPVILQNFEISQKVKAIKMASAA